MCSCVLDGEGIDVADSSTIEIFTVYIDTSKII